MKTTDPPNITVDFVKKDINLNETAQFIITVAEGAFAQAKISQDKEVFFKCGQQLNRYLDTLTS